MSGPGLKAGNRCSRTSSGPAVGHCERANASGKMQPNSRQRFLSVIQLLVSFRETLARVFGTIRICGVDTSLYREFPRKFRLLPIPRFFYSWI